MCVSPKEHWLFKYLSQISIKQHLTLLDGEDILNILKSLHYMVKLIINI